MGDGGGAPSGVVRSRRTDRTRQGPCPGCPRRRVRRGVGRFLLQIFRHLLVTHLLGTKGVEVSGGIRGLIKVLETDRVE